MQLAAAQATIVVEEPCRFEYRDGLVYVACAGVPTRAFRLHTFYATFHGAARCMQECHGAASAEIIEFPKADSA